MKMRREKMPISKQASKQGITAPFSHANFPEVNTYSKACFARF